MVGITAAVFVLLFTNTPSADVYVYKDTDGAPTFINVPCSKEQLKQGKPADGTVC